MNLCYFCLKSVWSFTVYLYYVYWNISINIHFPQHINIQARRKKKHFKSIYFYFSFAVAVQLLSRVQLFVTPWTAACQISLFFTVFWSLLKLIYWIDDAIQSSHPLLPPSPPALNASQHQGLFQWTGLFASGGQSVGASASASLLPMNIQGWDWLVWAPWSPRDLQESSPAPQFENISSLALSLLYGLP